ncbi:GIY-YIG nuclease family protein [Novosphingobium nitrogenifigens]|uniref:GIY-YIG nuclease family protein n=2 Tax=Novosphingobium nitrogenifigens TaxID=378548 RepID=UPI000382BEB0|nr:GIY-YIG nuclease family protein [Novosphingobium nitrogenifigens]
MAQVMVRSPQVKAEISRCAQLVQNCAGDASYVVYAILDPMREDPSCTYAGLPIYVGETRNVGGRIMEHFRTACSEMAKDTGREPYIRRMLESGVVAPFVVLQRLESRIDSLDAEIRWSQAFLAKGYPLTNLSPGQRKAMSGEKIEKTIRYVQWATSISDAMADGLRIAASCHWCGRVSIFQPSDFLAYFNPWQALRNIRAMAAHCHSCGTRYDHTLVRRHETVVAVAPPDSLDWEP